MSNTPSDTKTNSPVAGSKESRIVICSIVDYFPHAGCYLVQTPRGSVVPVTDASRFGCTPSGARPIGGYAIKTSVLVAFVNQMIGFIIGAVPQQSGAGSNLLPDSLTSRGRSGFHEEQCMFSPYADETQALGCYSIGRPQDAFGGDWGGINELGVAIYLGKLVAALKASDAAKIEAYFGDDLVKITGYNFELNTSCSEQRIFNDEGELHDIYRSTPFPWEAMGMGSKALATKDVEDSGLKKGAEDAPKEPKQQSQMIIPRHFRARGYMGDVEREYVILPPEGLAPETYENKSVYTGLLDICKNINGAYSIRSAKEITFEKYNAIAVPKEIAQPDDPLGDTSDDYASAGQGSGGDKPELKEFTWGSEENTGIRASQIFDYHAYLYNKYSVEQFRLHKKDWHLPEEDEVTKLGTTSIYDKGLRIGHQFLADLPTATDVKIDDRQSHSVKYYQSRSMFKQMDDGSIIIQDGYGSQIFMSGGSIFLSCVGDIWMQPGRNFITWAPHDAVVRSGNSVDISAAKKDVRIKAENNCQILAGNSGSGHVLIESKGVGQTNAESFKENIGEAVVGQGIIVKSPNAPIQMFGQAGVTISAGQDQSSVVAIDAGESGTLLLRGQEVITKATQSAITNASNPDDPTQSSSIIVTPTNAGMNTSLLVAGNIIAVPPTDSTKGSGSITAGGNVQSGGANVGNIDDLKKQLEEVAEQVEPNFDAVNERIEIFEETLVDDTDTSPGNDDYQAEIGFSFRDTEKDLKLDDTFVLPEACWQRMLRVLGQNTETWDEPPVKAHDNTFDTYPHPGKEGWKDKKAYATVDSVNVDDQTGRSKARESLTEEGAEETKVTLDSGYVINTQT